MKLSSSYFGMKKISVSVLLTVVVLALILGSLYFATPASGGAAQAENDLGWQVFIKYREGSVYHDLYSQDVYTKSTDETRAELFFLIKGWTTNDSYEYTVVKELKSASELGSCRWTQINPTGSTETETIGGVEYIRTSYVVETSGGISKDYYYFRRTYQTVDGSGNTFGVVEYYANTTSSGEIIPIYWYITVNLNSGSENKFNSIEGKYLARGAVAETAYDGTWTATPVTFTVVTEVMEKDKRERERNKAENEVVNYRYDTTKEIISYSDNFNSFYIEQTSYYNNQGLPAEEVERKALDSAAKKANWQFFNNGFNYVSVARSLKNVQLWFRVTDIGGESAKYAYYGNGQGGIGGTPIPINVDPETPRFEVSARTYDVTGLEEIEYRSNTWTSNRVRFTLALPADSKCISAVSFQYSVNGSAFQGMADTQFEVSETTSPVRFRAVTEAGKYYEYPSPYNVNIDSVVPQIRTAGFTIDPDDDSASDVCNKQLSYTDTIMEDKGIRSVVTVYDPGNNKIVVKVYNRNSEGRPVINTSDVKFEYMDGPTRDYAGAWRTMTDMETSGAEKIYRFSIGIGTEISLTRYVKFRITSGAGLTSEEAEVKLTVVNSVFFFDLLEDNYLIAQYNQDGWIADKATIRTVVSVDDEIHPTTQYTFYYWTEELTGEGSTESKIKSQAMSSVGRPVEFYDNKNGDIHWIYEFDLVASANAFFNIRAMNAAKKLNSDTRTTYDIIRIDVLEPTYTWDAYIYPSNLAEENISVDDLKDIEKIREFASEGKLLKIADKDNPDGGWVNGSVYFVLAVNVGVSGINLKDMEYARKDDQPLYDQSGNLVWQELPGVRAVDFHEANATGTTFGKYYYFFSLNNNDATKAIVVNEYRYRAYTGSGISTDVSFTAKFDSTTAIRLKSVDLSSQSSIGDNDHYWNVDSGSAVLSDDTFSVCDDFTLSFTSSLDREGIENHYTLYYYAFTADDMNNLSGAVPTDTELLEFARAVGAEDALTMGQKKYLELTGAAILTSVEKDRQGKFYFAVYVKSNTRNWKNVSNYSGYYVVCVEYDTLNITIQYRLDALASLSSGETDAEDMAAGEWRRGELEVYVTLPIDDKGTKVKMGDGYTYYYMLISFGSRGEMPDTDTILATSGAWERAYGSYNGADEFVFDIPFTDRAFYGYIGLSVCNKAKYRSIGYGSLKIIRIDNTTPDILGIVKGQTEGGLIEEREDEASGKRIISINTKDEITLDATLIHADLTHSRVQYYYRNLGSLPTDSSQIVYSTGEMTLLDNSLSVFPLSMTYSRDDFCTIYLMIFAINEVATQNTGFSGTTTWQTKDTGGYNVTLTTIYEFNYDPSELSSTTLMPTTGSVEYGSTGMNEFWWQEKVGVSMTIKSSKRSNVPNYYRFMFSVDSGATWFDYREAGFVSYYTSDEQKEIVFTAASLAEYVDKDGNYPFENGVTETFRFRAINKAGTYVECGNVYIAIDETIPEFEVSMFDQNGLGYLGGSTEDLFSGDENWTSGPVTVAVNITRMPAAGIRVYYYLRYLNSNRSPEAPLASSGDGKGKELVSYQQFTTDRLDGFNLNRDAILVLTVVSRAGGEERSTTANVRVSVDQQAPVFTMTGRAYEENDEGTSTGKEQIISSGEWTGFNTVSVSKARSVVNVSPVVYTYTWQDETSSAPESHVWSDTENNVARKTTGKLIVTATSANGDASKGKTYTVEFDINIDTTPPTIEFSGGINVIEGSEQYIDLQVVVHGDNLDIVEYITVKEDSRGFTFDPTGYVLSTSSVDNSKRHAADELDPDVYYRGYVHIYVRDKAGHEVHRECYVVPFPLTVNTIQLTDEDKTLVDELEHTLSLAVQAGYMEESRIEYFENLISRLHDRMETLQTEIDGYRDYLEKLANRSSFELRSDYAEMFRYRQTFQNYEVYGQSWIQTAITGDSTSPYYAYYKNFLNQFDKLFALMEQVEKVQEHVTQLPAINMVEAEDYTDILRVYDEYHDLTQDQKSCFISNLYNKLMDLKEACEVLLLSDRETGIVLDGDFAPGATVAVTKYDSSTDTYQNAQNLLMNTVDAEQARAIVSIHRVALTGAYAQTVASDIVVNLPIPEEYRSYIEFAVYALADDGSMHKVSGSKIQPDGSTVQFSTPSLGTYVLCVKADIQKTETSTDTYGSILGIPLTATMIKYMLYIGAGLFGIIFIVCLIMGIRQRRFLNSYNRAYRNSVYRRHSRGVPKGNKFR